MTTALADHIRTTPLIDSHEHLWPERDFVENGPDVLADLFGMYIGDDLIVAGAPRAHVERLLNSRDLDVEGRWRGVEAAWELCQFTGYGEAVRLMAQLVYGMETINLGTITAAAARNLEIRQPGGRLKLLRDVANLDHVQIDHFLWECEPDESGPDFFLYDLSWVGLTRAQVDTEALERETGVVVVDVKSLRQALAALVAKYGPLAIALKTQHAYQRTLAWAARTDAEAERVLQRELRGFTLTTEEKLCLGDWCLARGVELAAEHNLPVKIHTGLLAGSGATFGRLPDQVRATHLYPLIEAYPGAKFVLMHIAYPYSDELLVMAKRFPQVYLDMCWAWSINPRHAQEFVRRALHAVPINKLFAFGGDCFWPTETVGFAAQARSWLTRALQAEVDDGNVTETQAIQIATCMMQTNQRAVFDLEGTRAAIHAALGQ